MGHSSSYYLIRVLFVSRGLKRSLLMHILLWLSKGKILARKGAWVRYLRNESARGEGERATIVRLRSEGIAGQAVTQATIFCRPWKPRRGAVRIGSGDYSVDACSWKRGIWMAKAGQIGGVPNDYFGPHELFCRFARR